MPTAHENTQQFWAELLQESKVQVVDQGAMSQLWTGREESTVAEAKNEKQMEFDLDR